MARYARPSLPGGRRGDAPTGRSGGRRRRPAVDERRTRVAPGAGREPDEPRAVGGVLRGRPLGGGRRPLPRLRRRRADGSRFADWLAVRSERDVPGARRGTGLLVRPGTPRAGVRLRRGRATGPVRLRGPKPPSPVRPGRGVQRRLRRPAGVARFRTRGDPARGSVVPRRIPRRTLVRSPASGVGAADVLIAAVRRPRRRFGTSSASVLHRRTPDDTPHGAISNVRLRRVEYGTTTSRFSPAVPPDRPFASHSASTAGNVRTPGERPLRLFVPPLYGAHAPRVRTDGAATALDDGVARHRSGGDHWRHPPVRGRRGPERTDRRPVPPRRAGLSWRHRTVLSRRRPVAALPRRHGLNRY